MSSPSRRPRLPGLLAVLFAASLLPGTVTPATATGQNALWFGPGQDPTASFGANDIIRIDGTITFEDDCPEAGIDDWVYPATDVYIVAAGSVGGAGTELTDAGGFRANTIVAGASVFTDEPIGVTPPTGDIDEGVYDVVYDTCQDGTYEPGTDTLFPGAITVALPEVLPLANAAITAMKTDALIEYVTWLATRYAMNKMFDLADKAIKLQCDLGSPIACAMKELDYFDGIKEDFLALLLSQANHYLAIALDPPDPAYEQVTAVDPIDAPVDHGDSAISNATAETLLPLATEAALSEALLHAVERYQGAVAAGDAGWALEHAREAARLAGLLGTVAGAVSDELGDVRDALAAEPGFDEVLTKGREFAGRIWSSGFTAAERRALLNQGYTLTEVATLETRIRSGYADGSLGLTGVLEALDDSLAAHAETADSAAAAAAGWAAVVAEIEADPTIVAYGPDADAGGPYSAAEGSAITLGGSTPAPFDGAAWDLDADGQFDDATGLTPSVAFPTAGVRLIGLMVSHENRASVAYGVVTVGDTEHAPVLSDAAPADRAATLTVGSSASFSIAATDPEADPIAFEWTVDGGPVAATGPAHFYTPALADVGVHEIAVQASDGTAGGGSTRRSWDVVVLAPDADGDGWTATTDCDEADAAVHPSANELLGNGVDDDCDAGTPDAPPGGLSGTVQSWGSNANWAVGNPAYTTTYVAEPVPVAGLDGVVQIESGPSTGFVVLASGEVRGWGANGVGQLGIATIGSGIGTPISPLAVGGGPGNLSGITQLSADGGNGNVVARRADGTVVAWGDNQQRQVGDGSTVNARTYPVHVLSGAGGPPLAGVRSVEAGYAESYGIMDDGTVMAWGQIRCDGGTSIRIEPFPVALDLVGGDVKQVASGNQWTMFLKKDGTVLSCGALPPVAGRPVATMQAVFTPGQVGTFGPGSGVIDIAAGTETGLALKADGTVWAWGQNNNGELHVVGAPGATSVPAPVQVPLPPGAPVVDVTIDNACHALALRADGSVLGWGCDFFEQVGDGPNPGDWTAETPRVISMPGLSAVSVANSVWNSLALVRPVDDEAWPDRPATWVSASVADTSLGEATGGTFEVSLSAALPQDVTIDWTLVAGSSGAADLDLVSGSVTIPAGAASAQVAIPVVDDALDEDAETFTIALDGVSNGIQLARPQATGTIVDDDAAPSVSVEPTTVDEGDSSLTDAAVRVRLSGPSGKPVTVAFATADGTATAPADYEAASGTAIVPPGADETVIHLSVRGDTAVEPDEDLSVVLSGADNATLGEASATITITDDEPLVLDVTSPVVVEGDAGTTLAVFTVALEPAAPAGTSVSVAFTVEGLTATVPGDVLPLAGSAEFGPGDGPQQVTVAIQGDLELESDEAFRLALGEPVVSGGRTVLPGDNPPALITDDDESAVPPPPEGVPPTVDAGPDTGGAEGAPIGLDGTVTDPDAADTLAYAWAYAPGADVDPGAVCQFGDAASVDTTLRCTDDGTYTATLTVTDGFGLSASDSVTLTIANADPSVAIGTPAAFATIGVGATIQLSSSVSDPGDNDTVGCSIDWGDGTVESGTVAAGTCSGQHAYAAIGVPTVTVTATDDDGGSGRDELGVVISAPTTSVTGGGWIAGGTSRVSFGFVATPEGSGFGGQLQVRTGEHRFHGFVVTSLAASRPAATWSGAGRWDGEDGFTYLVSVQDLRNGGGRKGSPDSISVEIRDASGAIVFAASGPLEGGNIQVR